MKKKYQVFVSSTYEDLKDERAAVMQCLLDNDCIPVGMEQFPASEMSQMDYIKKMLDDCDYYVLISAGRYGSVDTDGIGFTEKEYDYAISKGLPVMSVLHKNISDLPSGKCEVTDEGRAKLDLFRKKISNGRMIDYYSDVGTLKYSVSTAINRCIRDYPAVGWVRGDSLTVKESVISDDEKDGLKLLAQMIKREADGSISFNVPDDIIEEKVSKAFEERAITNEEIDELLKMVEEDTTPKLTFATDKDIDKLFRNTTVSEVKCVYSNKNKTGSFTFDYSNNNGEYTIGNDEFTFVTKWSKASDICIHAYKDCLGANGAIARIKSPSVWPVVLDGTFDFSSRVRTPNIGDVIIWRNSNNKYAATKIISIKDDTRGAESDELTCEYVIYDASDSKNEEDERIIDLGNAKMVKMKNLAGGYTAIIGDEKSITEQIIKEHDAEIEKALSEI